MPTTKHGSGEARLGRKLGWDLLQLTGAALALGSFAVGWTENDQARVSPAKSNLVGMASVQLQCHGPLEGVASVGYSPLLSGDRTVRFTTECVTLGPWARADSPVALKPVAGQLLVPKNDADITAACAGGESPTFAIETVGNQTTVSVSCPASHPNMVGTYAYEILGEPAKP